MSRWCSEVGTAVVARASPTQVRLRIRSPLIAWCWVRMMAYPRGFLMLRNRMLAKPSQSWFSLGLMASSRDLPDQSILRILPKKLLCWYRFRVKACSRDVIKSRCHSDGQNLEGSQSRVTTLGTLYSATISQRLAIKTPRGLEKHRLSSGFRSGCTCSADAARMTRERHTMLWPYALPTRLRWNTSSIAGRPLRCVLRSRSKSPSSINKAATTTKFGMCVRF
jgi:hypothetical protein